MGQPARLDAAWEDPGTHVLDRFLDRREDPSSILPRCAGEDAAARPLVGEVAGSNDLREPYVKFS